MTSGVKTGLQVVGTCALDRQAHADAAAEGQLGAPVSTTVS